MAENKETFIPEPPAPLPLVQEIKTAESEAKLNEKIMLDALNLSWCFGYNKKIGAINLCQDQSRKLFLTSSHIGIVYDFEKNEQKLLQGHRNNISCCTVSDDKRWLVTADAGEDSTIIVWDLNSYIPVQTYFNTHLEGTISLAITPDSKYIASLSAQYPQVLAIWEWTTDSEVPICTAELDARFGPQSNIRFNLENIHQIVTNSHFQTVFYEWHHNTGFVYFSPTLNDTTFNKPVGKLTQSVFQSQSNRALTGTSLGNLVVWKTVDAVGANMVNKRAFKLFKLQDKSINVLTLMNNIIVIGDSDGNVAFIDQHLHILMWYKHIKLGPILSLSFSQFSKDFNINYNLEPVENDATLEYKKFVCTDFLISTNSATLGFITQSGTKVDIISQSSDKAIHALTCHPILPRICFGNENGYIQLWDYEKKLLISSRNFQKSTPITCLEFDKKGDHIAVGFKNGNLQLIDSISLEDCLKAPFTYSKDAITHIQFSEDSTFLATAEADYTLSIYKYNFSDKNNEKIATEMYTFLGRYRAHYKEIVDIIFGKYPDNDQIRLLSLGKDRVLVEYDLEKSNYDELVIKDSMRIEQYGVPLAMMWHPPIDKESFILTVNDQWKYKMYNSITKMCRKTLLGPTFGSHLKKILMIPNEESITENRYMAYITEDKLGLQKFPLTGNPYDSIALFAHPDGVANFVTSNDGKYLFTAGGDNNNVFMWKVNFKSLEAQSVLGGPDLKPFYGLIDGGRDGEFFKEMKELFYYCQLRHHGLNENTERVIKLTIPLSEISFLMRGLGFYPTEQEIEEMINEVKFSKYIETNEFVEDINLDDFIKLYINHRPAFGLDPYEIYNSFKILNKGYEVEDEDSNQNHIPRFVFLNELQTKGEHVTDYELADCISNLLHLNNQVDEMSHEQMAGLIDQHIPENLTVDKFMTELLGIPSTDFDEIMETWDKIRSSNTPRLKQSKKLLSNRESEIHSSSANQAKYS